MSELTNLKEYQADFERRKGKPCMVAGYVNQNYNSNAFCLWIAERCQSARLSLAEAKKENVKNVREIEKLKAALREKVEKMEINNERS